MEPPSVSNSIRDEKNGITYNVVAYRKLSREEIVLAIKHHRASKKTKKPKKGTTVTIVTIIGYKD